MIQFSPRSSATRLTRLSAGRSRTARADVEGAARLTVAVTICASTGVQARTIAGAGVAAGSGVAVGVGVSGAGEGLGSGTTVAVTAEVAMAVGVLEEKTAIGGSAVAPQPVANA